MLEAAKELEILMAERECYASAMDRMLAQPEQAPVAILNHAHGVYTFRNVNLKGLPDGEYLVYTHPPQRTEQESPKYSFKAHWEKDGRIGVVGAIVRPDGGVHLLQDIIDPPQRKPLTDEQYFEIGQRHWLSSFKVEQIHKELEEAAHGIKEGA
jgi:hypothetical protein